MTSAERRLAAIVVADGVGYSRMMAEDEDGTLSALRVQTGAAGPPRRKRTDRAGRR